jgi:AcrR family transcriptional regulator
MPPSSDLGERADLRREQILAEATRLFAASGFSNTEVQTIADNLGIGKGTVYRHFPSKRDMFMAAVDRGICLLGASVNEAAGISGEPLERILNAIRAYLGFFDTHPEIVELLIQERAEFRDRQTPTYFSHKEQSIGQWHLLLRDLMDRGIIRELPEEVIADYISDLLYGMVFTKYFSGREKPLSDQADQVIDIILSGIAPSTITRGTPSCE